MQEVSFQELKALPEKLYFFSTNRLYHGLKVEEMRDSTMSLEVLKKLDLITFSVLQNHFEISINTPAQILPFKKEDTNE